MIWLSRKSFALFPLVLLTALLWLFYNFKAAEDGVEILTCRGPEPFPPVHHELSRSYRDLLSTVYPSDRVLHSKTLAVAGKIYVIGLPSREDRRREMESLAEAMDITFTWHDATDMHSLTINTILERMRQARQQARLGRESEFNNPEAFPWDAWPDDTHSQELLRPDDIAGSELWLLPSDAPNALPALSPVPSPDVRHILHGVQGDNSVNPDWPLKPSEIACWHSHFEVLRQIADGDADAALIFEDDIDMEFDLERRLRNLWQFLPQDGWHTVMLGHCQSDEVTKPALRGTSYLHRAQHTMCTHAYAVSKQGAARLVRLLRTPLFAYSRPIDHAYIHLNHHDIVKAFSIYPPIVVQSKTTLSDIGEGVGPEEDFYLVDSALARVRAWKSQNVTGLV
ncbi:hypothetical protein FIBSPDRAFT_938406 [Athelia psychrophila]|uniref:Glycosyl transferase family 25 domain-containing protein n=1 Tax=Athelia psychrophila TaxID=1759441 RepID=A0A165YIX3_9AGAM|nr:hypothetical protein FIBSPDRAFT_938406 [Fibularhizoctonia sp. CBS 109695]